MIEGLKPYAKYKPAEMLWVGKLPKHWAEKRAKFFFREVDERSEAGKEELLSVSHKTGVTPRSQKNVTMFKAESYVGHKLCRPDDLAINTMWAWMGALGVSRHTGIISPAYGVYRPTRTGELLSPFVDALLRTPAYVAEFVCRSTGIRSSRLRLYPEQFLRIPLVCPPPDEQAAIVKFIDYADRRIRRYIRAKQKLIKLLEEQKQAIIHQAVTRGLDPNVRLKPSGVEWLGDVPEHWDVLKTSQCFRTSGSGTTPTSGNSRYYAATGIPWVVTGNLNDNRLAEVPHKVTEAATREFSALRTYPPGSLLVAMYGATIGKTALLDVDACVNQACCALVDPILVTSEFAQLAFIALRPALIRLGSGGGQPNVSQAKVRSFRLACPPLPEQLHIVEEVARRVAHVEQPRGSAVRELELLQEYRTRLIADVVTGKLDVRQAAAALPDELDDDQPELEEAEDELDDDAELTDEESAA